MFTIHARALTAGKWRFEYLNRMEKPQSLVWSAAARHLHNSFIGFWGKSVGIRELSVQFTDVETFGLITEKCRQLPIQPSPNLPRTSV